MLLFTSLIFNVAEVAMGKLKANPMVDGRTLTVQFSKFEKRKKWRIPPPLVVSIVQKGLCM